MGRQTVIKFFGVEEEEYPGASRKGCLPGDPKAVGWHVVVGGRQSSFATKEDFASKFLDYLNLAYKAGAEDAKDEMREKLGL